MSTTLMCGTVVWAYAYRNDSTKDNLLFFQKPIKGIISRYNSDGYADAFDPTIKGCYFVPFKKNSETACAWSKAVSIYARHFANTEAEATAEYNKLIDHQIDWHKQQIVRHELMKI